MLVLQGLMMHACSFQLALRRALVTWVHMLQLCALQQLLMHECVSQLALRRALVAWMLTWTVLMHVCAALVRLLPCVTRPCGLPGLSARTWTVSSLWFGAVRYVLLRARV